MSMRLMVVCAVSLALVAAGATSALAGLADSPHWNDIPVGQPGEPHSAFWPVFDTSGDPTGEEIKVTQEVAVGTVGEETEGLYKYRYEIQNDTGVGLASPLDTFQFDEGWDGGAILDHRETIAWGTWTFTTPGNAPKWVNNVDTAHGGIPIGEAGWFEAVSAGLPDRFYPASAYDGAVYAEGETTGPTPEPCTLGLLGLSGLAMIRLFKRKRE